jgi:hypothetical protein
MQRINSIHPILLGRQYVYAALPQPISYRAMHMDVHIERDTHDNSPCSRNRLSALETPACALRSASA